tara:strand:- start:238 stop:360 length:123 start_codon:yes stop_codon:yes gene_type:complete
LSDLIEMARKWKEEIDKLNAETDERIRLFLEEGIWVGKKY